MEIKELQDEAINIKILYLNGYLKALSLMNSYSVVSMRYKLFAFDFYSGNIEQSINRHSRELFDRSPDKFKFELKEITDWQSIIESELKRNFKGRIPTDSKDSLDYAENRLVRQFKGNYELSFQVFIKMLQKELISEKTNAYVLEIDRNGTFHPSFGLEIVFEILPNKVIILQLRGYF